MKIGDKIKIKVDHGYWNAGHEGVIACLKLKSYDVKLKNKTFDYGVLLDGDAFYAGFDENELEGGNEK